jgi:hypothetical protein
VKFHFPFGTNILDGELNLFLILRIEREKKTSLQILLLYYFQNPLFAQAQINMRYIICKEDKGSQRNV